MPKDRRAEKRAKEREKALKKKSVDLEAEAEEVSTKASREKMPPRRRKKKKGVRARTIVWLVLAALVIAFIVFLFVAGNFFYKSFFNNEQADNSVQLTSYIMTPTAKKDKVSYYLIGLMGAGEQDAMSGISVLCHNKGNNTISIMQIPTKTYIGGQAEWIVPTIGQVWGSPKPLDWCDVCRKRIYDPEKVTNEAGVVVHDACGNAVTQRAGSAYIGLIDAINSQIGLPVDHYFVLPQKGLAVLVDSMGGINVNLSSDITLGGQALSAGNQILGGQQVLEYCTYWDDDNTSDVARMLRQRQVLIAILQRLYTADPQVALEDMICEVMDSSTPARTDMGNTQMADILTGAFNAKMNSHEPGMKKTAFSAMTAYVAPGESTLAGEMLVYSLHRAELVALVNASFNAYGTAVSETDLKTQEIANSGPADQHPQTLDACLAEQVGMRTQ